MTASAKAETARSTAREVQGLWFALLLGIVLSVVAGAATGQLAIASLGLGGLSFAVPVGVWGSSVILPESTALLSKKARGRMLNACLAIGLVWFVFIVVGFVREELALWLTLAAVPPVALAIWCACALGKAEKPGRS